MDERVSARGVVHDGELAIDAAGSPRLRESHRVLSLHANAVVLLTHILASAGFGYLSWLVAARLLDTEAVGVSAAAVSAALLCSQLAVLGLSTSIVTFLPSHLKDPAPLLNSFVTIVLIAGSLCGGAFLAIAIAFLHRLRLLGSEYSLAVSFLGLVIVMTLLLLLDGLSVAIRRTDLALTRGVSAGVAKLAVLIIAWAGAFLSAGTVVFAWFVSTLGVCLLGFRQLHGILPGYRYRPRIDSLTARVALRNGLPNHVLNLLRFSPIWVIPLIVTETLSPSENAYWYGAWMIAFLVRFIPQAAAQAAFAEVTNGAASLASAIRRSVPSTLGFAVMPALVLIALAHPILSVLGHGYAEAGTTPLRLLVLGVLTEIAIEFYVMTRRVTTRLVEPIIVFLLSGIAAIAAAIIGAHVAGLVGVAVGWLVVDVAAGGWAALRVVQATRSAEK